MKTSSRLSLLVRTALVAAPLLTSSFASSFAYAREQGADAPPAPPPASEPAGPSGPSAPQSEPAPGAAISISGTSTDQPRDHVAEGTPEVKKEEKLNPIAGSIFFFDQSMTTQTAHLDTSPQLSYVPLY
ncbi:MAG: hypothetical protein ABIP39_16640, partial [Polyangiaceae bacterium]